MSDRALLEQLFGFLSGRTFITMDMESLSDMVKRYQNPPLTRLNRIAMQMTVSEYEALGGLMRTISDHLKEGEGERDTDSQPA